MLASRRTAGAAHCQSSRHTKHRLQPCQPARRSIKLSTHALPAPGGETLTYAVLGTGGLTFLATFFVLPKLYSRNTEWRDMLPELHSSNLKSITAREAFNRAGSSALLDVRLAHAFAKEAPRKAINVPLYIPIQNWDIASIIRRLGFAFFGVYGTELNPDFIQQVQEVVPRGREVMVICESGGSIESKPGNTLGFQSRSLKAIYYLQQAGFKVSHVNGGLASWIREGLPTTSDGGDDDDDGDVEPQPALKAMSLFARR